MNRGNFKKFQHARLVCVLIILLSGVVLIAIHNKILRSINSFDPFFAIYNYQKIYTARDSEYIALQGSPNAVKLIVKPARPSWHQYNHLAIALELREIPDNGSSIDGADISTSVPQSQLMEFVARTNTIAASDLSHKLSETNGHVFALDKSKELAVISFWIVLVVFSAVVLSMCYMTIRAVRLLSHSDWHLEDKQDVTTS